MKKLWTLLVAALLLSCEKVIDVDLNEADPQKVIEANLRQGADSLVVNITETGNYFGESQARNVAGANVSLQMADGRNLTALPVSSGIYRIDSLGATPHGKYTLDVSIDGEFTTASAMLNPKITVDSLYFEYNEGGGFLGEGYRPFIAFQDPAGEENFYRLLIYVNGELREDEPRILNDRLTDGTYRRVSIFGLDLKPGDTLKAELRTIDKQVYKFYNTLNDLIGGGRPGVAPGNPVTNLEGAIQLGYFGTYSFSQAQGVVPQ